MKPRICLALLVLASVVYAAPFAQPWYVGGTLHKGMMSQWRTADYRNKLATSGDMAITLLDLAGHDVNEFGLDHIRILAEQLESCVDSVAQDDEFQDAVVARVADACAQVMGWYPEEQIR